MCRCESSLKKLLGAIQHGQKSLESGVVRTPAGLRSKHALSPPGCAILSAYLVRFIFL